ncbi:MAG: aminotransferase class I/II-fold pyridoxal phosphate-dependent enzyme, partial [Gammaproteobacteria bacterium]
MQTDLLTQIAALKEQHLHRTLYSLETPQGPEVRIDHTDYLSFCSNDYLGLANEPEVLAAVKTGVDRYGLGSGASHLVTGHSVAHDLLEAALAEFTGRPRVLVFS